MKIKPWNSKNTRATPISNFKAVQQKALKNGASRVGTITLAPEWNGIFHTQAEFDRYCSEKIFPPHVTRERAAVLKWRIELRISTQKMVDRIILEDIDMAAAKIKRKGNGKRLANKKGRAK